MELPVRSALTHTKTCPTGQEFRVRTHEKVLLGPLCLEICSNEQVFCGMRYFPQSAHADANTASHYTVNLCNLNVDGPWSVRSMLQLQDRCYRSNRFSMGYYLTDHFGPPAYLVSAESERWIFAADFEPILWPYVVKYLLTVYSLQHEMLHLKAAGLAINGRGTLLVARGGGGKTLLLAQLCQAGAQFVSNTHTLFDGSHIIPVPTALRVRNDAIFGPLITARALSAAIKPGEYTADPVSDLGWKPGVRVPAHNICLVDYRAGRRTIREMDRHVLFDYMDQFALALNVYGLKEDVLDFLKSDVADFSVHTRAMRSQLRTLVGTCRAYYISCDSTDPQNLRQIYDLLGQ
jgi:hypothetical protein